MFKKILLALDGSRTAETALSQAVELSRLTGAELILVRAMILPSLDPGTIPTDLADMRRTERRMVERYLEDTKARALAAGAPSVRLVTTENEAAAGIMQAAEEEDVDLIVICSHGRSGLSRWLFGSVAEKVLRHCTRPMFLVRPPIKTD